MFAVAAFAALLASLGLIGADALWLVPLGGQVAHGHLPNAILLATAPSSGWSDVPRSRSSPSGPPTTRSAATGARGLQVVQRRSGSGRSPVGSCARRRRHGARRLGGRAPRLGDRGVRRRRVAVLPRALPAPPAAARVGARRPSRRIWLAVAIVAIWGTCTARCSQAGGCSPATRSSTARGASHGWRQACSAPRRLPLPSTRPSRGRWTTPRCLREQGTPDGGRALEAARARRARRAADRRSGGLALPDGGSRSPRRPSLGGGRGRRARRRHDRRRP